MTLRDMLDAGITFAGAINVRLYMDGEYRNDFFLPGDTDREIYTIPKELLNLEIRYIYPRMHCDDEICPHVVIELEDR